MTLCRRLKTLEHVQNTQQKQITSKHIYCALCFIYLRLAVLTAPSAVKLWNLDSQRELVFLAVTPLLSAVFSTAVPASEARPPTQSTSPSACPRAPAATMACTGSPAPHIGTGRAALNSDETSLLHDRWTERSHQAGCWTVAERGPLGDLGTVHDFMPGLSGHSSPLLTRCCRDVLVAGSLRCVVCLNYQQFKN